MNGKQYKINGEWPRRNKPANRRPSPVAWRTLQAGLEQIVSWQLGARSSSDALRCSFRKLAGGKDTTGGNKGAEKFGESLSWTEGETTLCLSWGKLRGTWRWRNGLNDFMNHKKMPGSPKAHEHVMIQKGVLTSMHKNVPFVHCHLKTTPAPKWSPCPQIPFPQPLRFRY